MQQIYTMKTTIVSGQSNHIVIGEIVICFCPISINKSADSAINKPTIARPNK